MHSIKHLFEDDHKNSVPKKYRERTSKKCDHFKGFEDSLPELKYPQENTPKFEEDLDEVRRCVREPSLGKNFLKKSHLKSEDVFKQFLKDEKVDWRQLDDILDEFDGVVTRLKFKYDRPRPYVYFEERGEDLETEKSGSPSFPSGHTAFAYFICDYLSDIVPDKQRDLEKLAEMIGQSRIENGVHFPSDVLAGRYIGEQAAQFLKESRRIVEVNNNKNTHKVFVRFLRKRAQDLRPRHSKKEAISSYAHDMSVYLAENLNIDIDSCHEASKNFISGYYLENCTNNKEIIRFFKGLKHAFFAPQTSMHDIVKLNKILEEESRLRTSEKTTLMGRSFANTEKIEEFVSKINKFNNKPFLKMAVLNWIAPFEKGNEKVTNIILLKETGFNFDITNQILSEDIDFMVESFYVRNDMEKLLS